MDLLFRFKKEIEQNKTVKAGDRVLVCVSGGLDSSVLLFLLNALKEEFALKIAVAHVNYHLRGAESLRDEKFVRSLAKKYSIDLFCEKAKGKLKDKENLQAEARNFRYNYFNKVARKNKFNKIALAHHMNDQAETILLHMIRGSGTRGMKGMPQKRIVENGVSIIRPLLDFKREELRAFAKKHSILFVEDSTNKTRKYDRNKIRNDLMKLLCNLNSKAVEHICQMSEFVTEEHRFLDDFAKKKLKEISSVEDKRIIINRKAILNLDKSLQKAIFRNAIQIVSGSLDDILSDHINKMVQIVFSPKKEGSYSLSKGLSFNRNADKLIISL